MEFASQKDPEGQELVVHASSEIRKHDPDEQTASTGQFELVVHDAVIASQVPAVEHTSEAFVQSNVEVHFCLAGSFALVTVVFKPYCTPKTTATTIAAITIAMAIQPPAGMDLKAVPRDLKLEDASDSKFPKLKLDDLGGEGIFTAGVGGGGGGNGATIGGRFGEAVAIGTPPDIFDIFFVFAFYLCFWLCVCN